MVMGILSRQDLEYLKNEFEKSLVNEIEIVFGESENCEFCNDVEKLLEEIASLNEKIKIVKKSVSELKNVLPKEVDKGPVILFNNNGNYNFGFVGIPSGYEFKTFIKDIIALSSKKIEIPKNLIKKIEGIKKEIEILVFVTPTCPYCPSQVYLAHQLSIAFPFIKSFMIEAIEFKEFAEKYNVFSVPKTVIRVNGENKNEYEGAAPVEYFIDQILLAVTL